MPWELVSAGPRNPQLREYEDRSPGPGEVLLRSTLSAEKHGTMLLIYRGMSPINEKRFDGEGGLFHDIEDPPVWDASSPMHLGNMGVGIIEEVGTDVDDLQVGDRVYGHLSIRESHTVFASGIHKAPDSLSDEQLVCEDPALVAFTGIREGHVRLGDTIAIFGMGAIGLMAVQMAKLSGARLVVAIEPCKLRADLAKAYGADVVIDPSQDEDTGLAIRRATDMKGVDTSLEVSGSHKALHHAIRGTRYGGTIVPVAWYSGGATDLRLGEEWHFNRQTLVSGARLESVPYRDYPLWDQERVEQTVLQLFGQGKLRVDGMLQPRVPISEAAEAYRMIDEQPERCVKLAVEFPGR